MAGGGAVHVPFYATGFRGDAVEQGLAEIAPVSLRYGATHYSVYRYKDDRYKFLFTATFPDKASWERYWYGEEFTRWRTLNNSHVQVPVVYGWTDVIAEGSMPGTSSATGEPTAVVGSGGADDSDMV